jgi:hypothetical protein
MLQIIIALIALSLLPKTRDKVPLFHKQNILKFLVTMTAFAIIGFMFFDIKLALNPQLEVAAAVFVGLFTLVMRKWSFKNFPSTQVRLFFLAQLIIGAALSAKALLLAKIWATRFAAVAVLMFYTYVMGLFRLNFKRFDDVGNGPQPRGLDTNPPLERWYVLSIGLTCGPTARLIHQAAGHGFIVLAAPYDTVLPDGTKVSKGTKVAWSDLMDTGVEAQTAEVQKKHFDEGHEDVNFVRPLQLRSKSEAELAELNERLWEQAKVMYKANHDCAEKLRALFDKIIDTCHSVLYKKDPETGKVIGGLSMMVSNVVGTVLGFANRCLNALLSMKLFVRRHEAFLRLQRRRLNVFHQQLIAKLVALRETIEAKLEATRDALKAKAYSYLRGYAWFGFGIGLKSLLPFWTCISFVIALYATQLKFVHQFGLGLLAMGSGFLDWLDPIQVLNDDEDFEPQKKEGYVEPVVPQENFAEVMTAGWFGWGIELRKLWDALATAVKPTLDKLLALLSKLGDALNGALKAVMEKLRALLAKLGSIFKHKK